MSYPEFTDPPGDNPADSNANEGRQNYKQEEKPPHSAEEGKGQYKNLDDSDAMRNELFSKYKRDDEFLRTEFSKMTNTSQTAVNAFDKMAESTLILSQEVAFYRKKSNSC
jgi:hypothetical protein